MQYQEAGVVDPMKYLCEMRQDRGGMIQTQVSCQSLPKEAKIDQLMPLPPYELYL